jgi:hypothetical protein
MARGIHGLPKVSPGPRHARPFRPCERATPKTTIRPFWGGPPQGRQPAAVFYPLGCPTLYGLERENYVLCQPLLVQTLRQRHGATATLMEEVPRPTAADPPAFYYKTKILNARLFQANRMKTPTHHSTCENRLARSIYDIDIYMYFHSGTQGSWGGLRNPVNYC